MRKYILSGSLLLLLTGAFSLVYAENTHTFFVSKEVGPCLTSGGNPKACDPSKPEEAEVLANVENLRSEWLAAAEQVCSQVVVGGNFLDGNTIVFTAGDQKISASITLRDLTLDDVNSPDSLGTKATTHGNLSTSTTSVMQDFAPKPLSLASQPYWTENAGSNSANSRNAILFEFFNENGIPTEVNSFGAWFGDLETRSDVFPAFMRTYDRDGLALTENISITEEENTDLSRCGSSSSAGKGCGNHTTRWIGFNQTDAPEVQKLLIVVGEDDLGSDGSREHLSFIGANLGVNAICPVPTVSSTPLPSSVPTATATPIPSPVITNSPEVTVMPTDSVIPTPISTTTPTQSTTPSITLSPSIFTTPLSTTTPHTHLPKSCKLPLSYRIEKKHVQQIENIRKIQKQVKRQIENQRNFIQTFSLQKLRR